MNNWQRLICLANVTGLPDRLAPMFLNAFNVSCSCTDVLCIALALLAQLEAINDVSVWCSKFRLQKSQEFLSFLGAHGLCCFRAPVKESIQACADQWMGPKAGSQSRYVQSLALYFSLLCLLVLPLSGLQACKYVHQPNSELQAASLPNLPKICIPKSHLSASNKGCL